MDKDFGTFKDLYDVTLKTTYPIKIGDRHIEPGEVVARFDNIQISGFNAINSVVTAHGGYHDRAHVYWEEIREVKFNFSQGVFSKEQFALLSNSNLIDSTNERCLLISYHEELESNEDGLIVLKYTPVQHFFLYNKDTGAKITEYELDDNQCLISQPFQNVIAMYEFEYNSQYKIVNLGQQLLNGFMELEGKTREKNDVTGKITTCVIKIPKLKMIGGLSMRLGAQANPVVGQFSAIGVPLGAKGNEYVAEFFFLDNDIDSDI